MLETDLKTTLRYLTLVCSSFILSSRVIVYFSSFFLECFLLKTMISVFLHLSEVSVLKNKLTKDCNWLRVLYELFVDCCFHRIVMYHPHIELFYMFCQFVC